VTGFLIKHPKLIAGYISLSASRFISTEDMKQTLTLISKIEPHLTFLNIQQLADLQSKVEELEQLNKLMRDRDKLNQTSPFLYSKNNSKVQSKQRILTGIVAYAIIVYEYIHNLSNNFSSCCEASDIN
jgi:hypothetical protein